jgi:hypothetical protein
MYSARDRDAILDSMANQMLNTTPYAAPKPKKTYRTVSPEAQALNMSQSTYEDIIRSGADPKQYYIDYQNRMMTEGGNYGTPGTSSYTGPQLLKYGQVIGGPGMGYSRSWNGSWSNSTYSSSNESNDAKQSSGIYGFC